MLTMEILQRNIYDSWHVSIMPAPRCTALVAGGKEGGVVSAHRSAPPSASWIMGEPSTELPGRAHPAGLPLRASDIMGSATLTKPGAQTHRLLKKETIYKQINIQDTTVTLFISCKDKKIVNTKIYQFFL